MNSIRFIVLVLFVALSAPAFAKGRSWICTADTAAGARKLEKLNLPESVLRKNSRVLVVDDRFCGIPHFVEMSDFCVLEGLDLFVGLNPAESHLASPNGNLIDLSCDPQTPPAAPRATQLRGW